MTSHGSTWPEVSLQRSRLLVRLRNLRHLNVDGNPFQSPPLEIAVQGMDTIELYFKKLENEAVAQSYLMQWLRPLKFGADQRRCNTSVVATETSFGARGNGFSTILRPGATIPTAHAAESRSQVRALARRPSPPDFTTRRLSYLPSTCAAMTRTSSATPAA